jgi:hypothetical protein
MPKPLNLNSLLSSAYSVEWQGRTYAVKPITPRIATMIDDARNADDDKSVRYYDAAAKCVPDLPRSEFDDMTVQQVMAILDLAMQAVYQVQDATETPETADPNAPGLATIASEAPTAAMTSAA